jgi:hypothetical protein
MRHFRTRYTLQQRIEITSETTRKLIFLASVSGAPFGVMAELQTGRCNSLNLSELAVACDCRIDSRSGMVGV